MKNASFFCYRRHSHVEYIERFRDKHCPHESGGEQVYTHDEKNREEQHFVRDGVNNFSKGRYLSSRAREGAIDKVGEKDDEEHRKSGAVMILPKQHECRDGERKTHHGYAVGCYP